MILHDFSQYIYFNKIFFLKNKWTDDDDDDEQKRIGIYK